MRRRDSATTGTEERRSAGGVEGVAGGRSRTTSNKRSAVTLARLMCDGEVGSTGRSSWSSFPRDVSAGMLGSTLKSMSYDMLRAILSRESDTRMDPDRNLDEGDTRASGLSRGRSRCASLDRESVVVNLLRMFCRL